MSETFRPLPVDVEPDEVEVNSKTTTTQLSPADMQGKYRWCFEYADKTFIDKYNSLNAKNVYVQRVGDTATVQVPLSDVVCVALYNVYNNRVVEIKVPSGAVVFQRRRVAPINYEGKFFVYKGEVPAYQDPATGKIYPPKPFTKTVPYEAYSECWIVGWRKRESDNSVSTEFRVLYPVTGNQPLQIDTHTAWCSDGSKDWLREPEWYPQEQV